MSPISQASSWNTTSIKVLGVLKQQSWRAYLVSRDRRFFSGG